MFCNQCGNQNADNTRFCNKCGFNIEPVRQSVLVTPSQQQLTIGQKHSGLILVLSALMTIVGLGTIFGLMVPLTIASPIGQGHNAPLLIVLAISGITCLGFIVSRFLRMLNQPAFQQPAVFEPGIQFSTGPMNKGALPQPRYEPIGSITENTTSRLKDYVPAGREGSY